MINIWNWCSKSQLLQFSIPFELNCMAKLKVWFVFKYSDSSSLSLLRVLISGWVAMAGERWEAAWTCCRLSDLHLIRLGRPTWYHNQWKVSRTWRLFRSRPLLRCSPKPHLLNISMSCGINIDIVLTDGEVEAGAAAREWEQGNKAGRGEGHHLVGGRRVQYSKVQRGPAHPARPHCSPTFFSLHSAREVMRPVSP